MAKMEKKSRKIQFQIGWGGLLALTMSTICVFMWVFILGFWVGQKLVGRTLNEPLQTQAVSSAVPEEQKVTSLIPDKGEVLEPYKETTLQNAREEKTAGLITPDTEKNEQLGPGHEPVKKEVRDTVDIKGPGYQTRESTKNGKYFALQIASYREKERAYKEADRWRDKGYQTVIKRVELGSKKEIFYRVHLGQYRSVEEATSSAKNLAQKYNLQSYVVPIND